MSIYLAIFASALIDGIFAEFQFRTGIDASPSGVGIQTINILEPLLPSHVLPQAEFYKILIMILPWIITVITIFKAPNRKYGVISLLELLQ